MGVLQVDVGLLRWPLPTSCHYFVEVTNTKLWASYRIFL